MTLREQLKRAKEENQLLRVKLRHAEDLVRDTILNDYNSRIKITERLDAIEQRLNQESKQVKE